MPAPETLQVHVVNDHPVVVQGLAAVLTEADPHVVTTDQATAADVVLYDTFGHVEGWDRVTELLEVGRPVAVFTWQRPPAAYLDLVEDGLIGVIAKSADAHQLVRWLRDVAAGRSIHRPASTPDQLVGTWPGREQGLTSTEAEVLALVVQGLAHGEIAREVFLSVSSVKHHLASAYRKAGVASRAEAVLWGLDHGLEHGARLGAVPH